MKYSLYILLCVTMLSAACNNDAARQKEGFDALMKLHDKSMGDSEMAYQTKTRLDSLIKVTTTDEKTDDTLHRLSAGLTKADDSMEKWMQQFKADDQGKTPAQAIKYYNDQRSMLLTIDSALITADHDAAAFIKTIQ